MKRRITSTRIPEHPLCRPADAAFFVLFVEARLGEKIGKRREPIVRRPDWEIDEGLASAVEIYNQGVWANEFFYWADMNAITY